MDGLDRFSIQDMTTPLEQLDLNGNVKALKEWNEGYEDLEAIPFSFVVEFRKGRPYWSLYADSEEEKVRLFLTRDKATTNIYVVQTLGAFQSSWGAMRDLGYASISCTQ